MNPDNLMDDQEPKPGRSKDAGLGGPGGTRAPAKGDSTPSQVPLDGATFIEQPENPPADPGETAIGNVPVGSSVPSRYSTGPQTYSGVYRNVVLQPGDLFGGRYEILQLLGEGGMGSVYKAADREVERTVALKIIRPDLASNPAILARFKQELLTAHQVTHKNVIRIYDMAEAEGVRFITMEFVEGTDLRRVLLDHGKLPPQQAVEIIRQVCLALDAAHSAGIIHRDLKPQNIMQDKNGRILVMDFGLARSVESGGMTQTGALLGTIEYMSPEQSMGKNLDRRSDLFAVGLIFYELLSGKTPFKAETAMASLLLRNQERAVPVRELDESIPVGLSDIVSKCLERDLTLRYQSAAEILTDLDALQGKRPVSASMNAAQPNVELVGQRGVPWKWIAPGVIVLILGVGGWVYRGRVSSAPESKAAAGPEISLAILPFHNATTDVSIDWIGSSMADMLSTDVGQSARLRIVTPDRVRQILKDLRIPPNASIDADMLRRIAELSNADTVISGQYAKFGDQIQIDATLQDLKHNRREPLRMQAASEKEIPATVDGLAELIRKNLALSSDVLKELKATAFQPSSKSVPALRGYTQAMELVREGKNLDAVKMLQAVVQDDPQFALAYSRLAEADHELGYDAEAETNSRRAVELSQTLPTAEKYLVEATHARVMNDSKKAIEAYENLAKIFAGNSDVEYTLGSLYSGNGEYDKARAQFATILKADPKNIKALWQMGMLENHQENFQAALQPLNEGLSLAVQVDNQEQKALILQSIGICYRLMNKPEEALKSIRDSMEITSKLGMKRLLANNLSEMALNQLTIGKPDAALTNFNQSLQILREIGMKKDYGDILVNRAILYEDRGDYDKALQDYKDALQIERDTNDINYQALLLSNIGGLYSEKNEMDNALIYYQQSLELRQKVNEPVYLATTLSSLGDAYAAMGDYDKALENLMKALDTSRKANDTKGAASASQSIGKILAYQGRLGAAVSAMQDAVNGYRSTNNKSQELADSLNDLADTLTLVARGDESGKLLEEATKVASELKNESIHSELLNTQGDAAYYRGDYKAARSAYEQAAQVAANTKDRGKILISRMNLARDSIAEGRTQAAIPELRAAIQQAETLHLKYDWLRGSVDLAEALIKSKDYAHARQELDQALNTSEKLGTRLQTAIIHFQLGNLLKQTGDASGAASQYRQAAALLDEMKKEPGAEHILDRADLKTVYKESIQGAGQAKG